MQRDREPHFLKNARKLASEPLTLSYKILRDGDDRFRTLNLKNAVPVRREGEKIDQSELRHQIMETLYDGFDIVFESRDDDQTTFTIQYKIRMGSERHPVPGSPTNKNEVATQLGSLPKELEFQIDILKDGEKIGFWLGVLDFTLQRIKYVQKFYLTPEGDEDILGQFTKEYQQYGIMQMAFSLASVIAYQFECPSIIEGIASSNKSSFASTLSAPPIAGLKITSNTLPYPSSPQTKTLHSIVEEA